MINYKMDVTNPQAITQQVYKLETMAHGLAEAYREDLEVSFGEEGIKVKALSNYDWATRPEQYFYDVCDSKNSLIGIILPISKKAVIGSPHGIQKEISKVDEVLLNRGYEVFAGKGGEAYHFLRELGIGE